jgi:hypothetical protein
MMAKIQTRNQALERSGSGESFWIGNLHYDWLSPREFEHMCMYWMRLRDRALAKRDAVSTAGETEVPVAQAIIGEVNPRIPEAEVIAELAPEQMIETIRELRAEVSARRAEVVELKAQRRPLEHLLHIFILVSTVQIRKLNEEIRPATPRPIS